ncbi:MAG TPA: hypothetical protein VFE47_00600 [Tepidisphaeraceae bacterium]|jgi:hypothetical protein|nr:hypothetical protein [Tepidisphaeraceae bacterium]
MNSFFPPSTNAVVERLESRTFLSVSPATLSTDQQQLRTDNAAYAADMQTCKQMIATDKAKVNADSLSGRRHLADLQKQLATDQATRNAKLKLDRANANIAAAGDNGVIKRDNVTIRVDKNNPSQLAIDNQKLIADKIQLESDHVKFSTILLNDDANTQSIILADQQAIVTARATADNAALQQDQQTLLSDQQACLTKLAADQIKILNDQLKIAQDTATA